MREPPVPQQPTIKYEVDPRSVKRLMLKVLYRALGDWVFYRESRQPSRRRDAADAYRWLFLDETSEEMFSFKAVCDVLKQDPVYVRKYARDLTKKTAIVLFRGKSSDAWEE